MTSACSTGDLRASPMVWLMQLGKYTTFSGSAWAEDEEWEVTSCGFFILKAFGIAGVHCGIPSKLCMPRVSLLMVAVPNAAWAVSARVSTGRRALLMPAKWRAA